MILIPIVYVKNMDASLAFYVARGIADEAFGRSIVLRDPNVAIQVNAHE